MNPSQMFPVLVEHRSGRQDIVNSYEPSDRGATLDCSDLGCTDCETWCL